MRTVTDETEEQAKCAHSVKEWVPTAYGEDEVCKNCGRVLQYLVDHGDDSPW